MRTVLALVAAVPLLTAPADRSPTRVEVLATATIRSGVRVGAPQAGADAPVPAGERVRACDRPDRLCRLLIRDMP